MTSDLTMSVARGADLIRVPFEEAKGRLAAVYLCAGLSADDANTLAMILATNSLEGLPSHGLHFFYSILKGLRTNRVLAQGSPTLISSFGAWEQWDGARAPGPLNALRMTTRAMELAQTHGVGVVGLRNTYHWARPGYYGSYAARLGFGFICWGNALATMAPWGSTQPRLGNNPIVFALPDEDSPLVLDMAQSQFSMGRLHTTKEMGELLPVSGGYDEEGNLSKDPSKILQTGRVLPAGYWKGSGLALLLDLFAATLANGNTTLDKIENLDNDTVSQVFISFDLAHRMDPAGLQTMISHVVNDLRNTWAGDELSECRLPGDRVAKCRTENMVAGIPVDPAVWKHICDESGTVD